MQGIVNNLSSAGPVTQTNPQHISHRKIFLIPRSNVFTDNDSLFQRSLSNMFESYSRFLDLLKMYAAMMRLNQKNGYSHKIEVIMILM